MQINDIDMLKIGLVSPPIGGHMFRGTGTYYSNLQASLIKNPDIKLTTLAYKDPKNTCNLLHYPYFDPFFLTLPYDNQNKYIVTVHDLIPLSYPEFFPPGIKGMIKWQIQKYLLKQSQAILTDSQYSKKEITSHTGIAPEKIHVVYLGINDNFRIIKDNQRLKQTLNKFKLPEKFVLYVGDVNYNKNIPVLIKAFAQIHKIYPELKLVLIGKGFLQESYELNSLIKMFEIFQLSGEIFRLSCLDNEDLVNLYNQAKIYIQPSLAEGFGLPVLEAMKCGCPTVVSDRSSLPEISGDASLFVNPEDPQKTAEIALLVLKNSNIRRKLIQKGLARSKYFTWENTAKQTITVYQKYAKNN